MSHLFGDGTQSVPAAWHPEPNFRGTWTILSTCALTMLLCIWTVIHLNIPDQERKNDLKWRRCEALVVGLLAPELVAWNAWQQRREAKELTKDMGKGQEQTSNAHSSLLRFRTIYLTGLKDIWRKIKVTLLLEADEHVQIDMGDWPSNVPKDIISAWTDTHSWYALMGGFAFDTASADKPFLPDQRKVLTLTRDGILFMALNFPQLLPRMTEENIQAQSKSDSASKLITCWQAAWFCVQCATRLAQGLSICLLELNVFGHAVCALLIYAIWWNKPKDVEEPTKLSGEDSNSVAALLFTVRGAGLVNRWNAVWVPSEPKEGHNCYYPVNPVEIYQLKDLAYPNCINFDGSFWTVAPYVQGPLGTPSSLLEKSGEKKISIDRLTANRLAQIRHHEILLDLALKEHRFIPGQYVSLTPFRNRLVDVLDLGSDMYSSLTEGNAPEWSFWSLTVATGLYGGLHAIAWNASFPTSIEQLLWRASSLTVALSGIGLLLISYACSLTWGTLTMVNHAEGTRLVLKLWRKWYGNSNSEGSTEANSGHDSIESFLLLVAMLFVPCWAIWYVFCRAFLVVESFINLAHLSKDTLMLPNWSQYVPHIT